MTTQADLEKAREIVLKWSSYSGPRHLVLAEMIAQALADERKRNVKVAESYIDDFCGDFCSKQIASAIREGSNEVG